MDPDIDYASLFEEELMEEEMNSSKRSNDSIVSNIGKKLKKTLSLKKTTEDSFYGLPIKVKDLLKIHRNISSLYPWQDELLNIMHEKMAVMNKIFKDFSSSNLLSSIDDITEQSFYMNLFYLSPTSGGKTLVAELLILYTLLVLGKSCIFVMPFVSIVQEKVELMIPLADELNFLVEEYAGNKGTFPPKVFSHPTLYICTIEKAHSLVNTLIETDRLSKEIGTVVADELHMIGDGSRGAILEMLLSKVKYYSKLTIESNLKLIKEANQVINAKKALKHPIQIIATTATLQNMREMANYLDAFMYEGDFRPVELKEYIKVGTLLLEVDKANINKYDEDTDDFVKPVRNLDLVDYTNQMKQDDPDGLIALVKEVIPNESCLIFCPTKKNCENVATLLASHLPEELKQHNHDLKLKLYNDLKDDKTKTILKNAIQFGIAFHNTALITEDRQLIEQAYRDGVLCLLTCTSTLAAGVNLPTKRVIIRSPFVSKTFIDANQYKQMIGRAGRAGMTSTVGESILIFQSNYKKMVSELIRSPYKKCVSSLECNNSKPIRMLVLSLIGLDLTRYGSEILLFFKQTFYMHQKEKLYKKQLDRDNEADDLIPKEFELISGSLKSLVKKKLLMIKSSDFVTINEKESIEPESDQTNLYFGRLEMTKLGKAVNKSNIDLDYVDQFMEDLDLGINKKLVKNSLFLHYISTPYELVNSQVDISYDIYADKFNQLNANEVKCAGIIGVTLQCITKKRFSDIRLEEKKQNIIKKFFFTLIFYELSKTNSSIEKTSTSFDLDQSFITQICQTTASFRCGIIHFLEVHDKFGAYKNELKKLNKFSPLSAESAAKIQATSTRATNEQSKLIEDMTLLEAIRFRMGYR